MDLAHVLRLSNPARLAIVGAGGKTTALFLLARQMDGPVWVTATTHLGLEQLELADRCLFIPSVEEIARQTKTALPGVTLFMQGPAGEARTQGLSAEVLAALKTRADALGLPLLVEADGSRTLPLKAPAAHEPAIPEWVDTVVTTAGLSGLGLTLEEGKIHRPEIFAKLTGLPLGAEVTPLALITEMLHTEGGLKNIPRGARRVALLNQADTPDLQSVGEQMAYPLLTQYDAVIVAALNPVKEKGPVIHARYESIAAVVLAGGASRRLARPKQLLEWRGEALVHRVARTALESGLAPVIVVTGAEEAGVRTALADLPVDLVHNPAWEGGQSTSIQAGVRALPANSGAAVFLLSDQPQVPVELLDRLAAAHAHSQSALIAPRVNGRRANPVLFDRVTFPDLLELTGDVGGRAIFNRYPIETIDWPDENLLLDVDTEEDYARLREVARNDNTQPTGKPDDE